MKFEKVKYVYTHNLQNFDGIFLFSRFLRYKGASTEPIMHEDKLIAIKFKVNDRIIIFKDSYLMLNHSLRKLCQVFKVPKFYFPFYFFY